MGAALRLGATMLVRLAHAGANWDHTPWTTPWLFEVHPPGSDLRCNTHAKRDAGGCVEQPRKAPGRAGKAGGGAGFVVHRSPQLQLQRRHQTHYTEGSIQHIPLPSALNTALSHQVIMKAGASRFAVSYF